MKLTLVTLFALAMGFLESAVVVYLRALLYPNGFDFPLNSMPDQILITELLREAATIIMLVCVSIFTAEKNAHRFAWFLYLFAIWDIAYYLFLKVIILWPSSFFDWDILFLIPVLWTGPVLTPLLICIQMIVLSFFILKDRTHFKPASVALLVSGTLICLWAFMSEFIAYHYTLSPSPLNKAAFLLSGTSFIPVNFPWFTFIMGYSITSLGILITILPNHSSLRQQENHFFI